MRPDRKNGGTILTFRLRGPAVVRFTILRVSPSCERIGSFRVRARAGANRIRFRGRFRGAPLAEGTYRLLIRARGASADAAAVTLVVDRGRPLDADALRTARQANVCGLRGAVDGEAAESTGPGAAASRGSSGDRNGGAPANDRAEGPVTGALVAVGRNGRILGARFARAVEDPTSIHPLVWFGLALSILLLAAASIPTTVLATQRFAEPLVYKRFEFALAGAAALGAAFLLYVFS